MYQTIIKCVLQAFNTLHLMHHEATACHVAGDIVDLLTLVLGVLRTARQAVADKKGTANLVVFLLCAVFILSLEGHISHVLMYMALWIVCVCVCVCCSLMYVYVADYEVF